MQVTAWQDDGLVVDRLVPDGSGGWRTTRPIPAGGDWKVQLRLQPGRHVLGVPVRLPADPAIPARGVAAESGERAFVPDRTLLQRERRTDVPGWLWGAASALVLALAAAFLGALAWGLGRVARRDRRPARDASEARVVGAADVRPHVPLRSALAPGAWFACRRERRDGSALRYGGH